jgi:mannose-6-phosphate isomerase-like protein (cupin superfamily)
MWIIVHSDQPLKIGAWGEHPDACFSAWRCHATLHFRAMDSAAAGVPTHEHPVEEALAIVKGEAGMWIDEKRGIVTGGQSLIVPAHRKHGFRNIGSETLHVHAVLASAIFEATFDGGTVQRWQS